jgi:hypothetical protein
MIFLIVLLHHEEPVGPASSIRVRREPDASSVAQPGAGAQVRSKTGLSAKYTSR